jgi:hypothetical protein
MFDRMFVHQYATNLFVIGSETFNMFAINQGDNLRFPNYSYFQTNGGKAQRPKKCLDKSGQVNATLKKKC